MEILAIIAAISATTFGAYWMTPTTMISDIKSSALAFVYAWAIILVPLTLVSSIISLTNPQTQESI
jgi:hypothetical protein